VHFSLQTEEFRMLAQISRRPEFSPRHHGLSDMRTRYPSQPNKQNPAAEHAISNDILGDERRKELAPKLGFHSLCWVSPTLPIMSGRKLRRITGKNQATVRSV
jgi:hypothetical protein